MDNEKSILMPNTVSVGITWVDGRIIFKNQNMKWALVYYGICHYDSPFDRNSTPSIWNITPIDYERPLMITTIKVDPIAKWCARARICLDFKCELNRFNRETYMDEFKGCGGFTLGMPNDFGTKDIWFNEGKWREVWIKYMIPIDGGVLRFKD